MLRLKDNRSKGGLAVNILFQMIYELLILLLPLITSPYISRVLGASGLGEYSFHYSIAYYFVLFAMLGIRNYGSRVIAQNRSDSKSLNITFSGLLFDHLAVSVIVTIAYLVYSFWVSENCCYSLLLAPMVISALFDISWFYFGIEQFKITVAVNSIIKVLTVMLVFGLVRSSNDLWLYILIMSGGFFLSQILLWIPVHKFVKIIPVGILELRKHFKPLFVLFIPAVAISLYKYMDKIMLGSLESKIELGYYENAEKIVNLPVTIIGSIGTVMLSKVSGVAASADEKKRILYYIDISMDLIMCLSFGLAFGLCGVSQVFAPVFWGSEFEPCVVLIRGLSVTIPFIAFANIIRTQCLIPLEKDKEYLISIIVGAIINLLLNGFLIPRIGSIGAMIGTIAAECAVMIIQTYFVKNELQIKKYLYHCFSFVIIGGIMGLLIHSIGLVIGNKPLTLFLQVATGGVFYCICSLMVLYKNKNDLVVMLIMKYKDRLK